MVRVVSPSEYARLVREEQRRRQQAIDRHNAEVRRVNDANRRAFNEYNRQVDDYNREVRRRQDNARRAIDNYNRGARVHNSRVLANRQRLVAAINSLRRQPVVTQYVTFRTSVEEVSNAYVRLEGQHNPGLGPTYDRLLDLSEREAANSVEAMNTLLGEPPHADGPADELVDARLTDELRGMSPDLDDRWKGAVYALNPQNPDAARHFCTSAREIITQILDIHAPDSEVIHLLPDCDRTRQGTPTRRSKVRFFLKRKGMSIDALEDFVEQDMENVVQLFRVFNDGTHGSAGTFDLRELKVIQKRVEDGIYFLSRIIL